MKRSLWVAVAVAGAGLFTMLAWRLVAEEESGAAKGDLLPSVRVDQGDRDIPVEEFTQPLREPVEIATGGGTPEDIPSSPAEGGDEPSPASGEPPAVGSPEFLRQRLDQYRELFSIADGLPTEQRLENALALNKIAVITILDSYGQYEVIPEQGVSVTSRDRSEWIATQGRMYRLMPGQFPEYTALTALSKSQPGSVTADQVEALIGDVEGRLQEAAQSIAP